MNLPNQPDPESRVKPMLRASLRDLGEVLEGLSAHSLFVVADPLAYERSGAERVLGEQLGARELTLFQDFDPNPSLDELNAGISAYRRGQPDVVLAIGGGTAIDLAKLIGFFSVQECGPRAWIERPVANASPPLPLIAVPTTAGTGSEATDFAVLYVDGQKHSIADPCLLPEFAILDVALTESMPAELTAETGLDAFAHAIESMWSVGSTPESIRFASESVRLTLQHLQSAVRTPTRDDRAAMSRASHLAGKAIRISKTTASHALSYAITSQFGVPHGRAAALTLGPMLTHNSRVTEVDCNDARGVYHVRRVTGDITEILGCEAPEAADLAIRCFVDSIGCPSRLSAVGVRTEKQIKAIAEHVNLERLANNPRGFTPASLRSFLLDVL